MKLMMGFLTVTLLTSSAFASTDACNFALIRHNAGKLRFEAKRFHDVVQTLKNYDLLKDEAFRVEKAAHQLHGGAQKQPCWRLRREFEDSVVPAFNNLRQAHRALQKQAPNQYVKNHFQQLRQAYDELDASVEKHTVPPVNPCQGVEGNYAGVCRVVNKPHQTSPINVSVLAQGGACVASSGYFQPVALAIAGGQGTANVNQVPGGAAIKDTSLRVWGAGRFQLQGYNYAGKFFFQCSN